MPPCFHFACRLSNTMCKLLILKWWPETGLDPLFGLRNLQLTHSTREQCARRDRMHNPAFSLLANTAQGCASIEATKGMLPSSFRGVGRMRYSSAYGFMASDPHLAPQQTTGSAPHVRETLHC